MNDGTVVLAESLGGSRLGVCGVFRQPPARRHAISASPIQLLAQTGVALPRLKCEKCDRTRAAGHTCCERCERAAEAQKAKWKRAARKRRKTIEANKAEKAFQRFLEIHSPRNKKRKSL